MIEMDSIADSQFYGYELEVIARAVFLVFVGMVLDTLKEYMYFGPTDDHKYLFLSSFLRRLGGIAIGIIVWLLFDSPWLIWVCTGMVLIVSFGDYLTATMYGTLEDREKVFRVPIFWKLFANTILCMTVFCSELPLMSWVLDLPQKTELPNFSEDFN